MNWYSCLCYAVIYPLGGCLVFNPRCIPPSCLCILFCLRTSKSLSMGEFDQCHICIGFSGYLGFIFWWINLHLFAILHIFSDYARFWFLELLLQISMIQAKILGETFEMNPS